MFTRILNIRSLVAASSLCVLVGATASDSQALPTLPPPHAAPANHLHGTPQNRGLGGLAKTYRNWSARCYFPAYRCYGYYNPAKARWFYWYAPFNQYLPISLLATYPPVNVLNTQTIPGNGALPDLPPGATSAPVNGNALLPPDQPPTPDVKQNRKQVPPPVDQ